MKKAEYIYWKKYKTILKKKNLLKKYTEYSYWKKYKTILKKEFIKKTFLKNLNLIWIIK